MCKFSKVSGYKFNTQKSAVHQEVNKDILVCPYSRYYSAKKKKQTTDTHISMDESQKHDEWQMLEAKE